MACSGFPSMTALLGLLAVAGYQNRDRIAEMMNQRGGMGGAGMGGTGGGMSAGGMGGTGGLSGAGTGGIGGGMGGLPGGLGGLLGGLMGGGGAGGMSGGSDGGLGGLLGGGLGELDQRFRQNGRGQTMDSWVGRGPNQDIEPHDLEAALGPDVLDDLTEATGLSRQEVLQRLSRELPHAVDQYTPQGHLPQSDEFG